MSCVESEEWNVEGPQRSMGSLGRTGRGNGVSSSSSCSVASLRRAPAGRSLWLRRLDYKIRSVLGRDHVILYC